MEEKQRKWFGKDSVAALIVAQQKYGASSVTRTMAAAYKQLVDVEWLLKLLVTKKVKLTEEEKAQLAKVIVRHEKYKAEA